MHISHWEGRRGVERRRAKNNQQSCPKDLFCAFICCVWVCVTYLVLVPLDNLEPFLRLLHELAQDVGTLHLAFFVRAYFVDAASVCVELQTQLNLRSGKWEVGREGCKAIPFRLGVPSQCAHHGAARGRGSGLQLRALAGLFAAFCA